MHREFIQIWLEGDGRAGTEIIGFGARFIRELAKTRLRPESEEESARPVPRVRSIDRPNVDILLLRATDGGIEIRAPGPKISAKIVDPGRDQENGSPVRRRRQPLHQIQKRQIGTRERTPTADGEAQSLGRKFMVVGEILGEHGGAIAGVGYRNISSVRLAGEKRLQIAPLVCDVAV